MSTVAAGGAGARVRQWAAQRLTDAAARLEPRPAGEDPHSWEVTVVKVAARAEPGKAITAVHEATRHLDDRTIRMVLLLLASDVAHSPRLTGDVDVWEWADEREFLWMQDRLRQEGFDASWEGIDDAG